MCYYNKIVEVYNGYTVSSLQPLFVWHQLFNSKIISPVTKLNMCFVEQQLWFYVMVNICSKAMLLPLGKWDSETPVELLSSDNSEQLLCNYRSNFSKKNYFKTYWNFRELTVLIIVNVQQFIMYQNGIFYYW